MMPIENATSAGAPNRGWVSLFVRDDGGVMMGIGFHGIVFGLLIAGMFGLGGLVSDEIPNDLRDVAALLPNLYEVKAMLSDLI